MSDDFEMMPFERRLRAAYEMELTGWTPQCIDPPRFLSLLEQGDQMPDAAPLRAHLDRCAYCRNEYEEVQRLWHAARTPRQTAATTTAPANTGVPADEDAERQAQSVFKPQRLPWWTRWAGWSHRLLGPTFGFAAGAVVVGIVAYSVIAGGRDRERRLRVALQDIKSAAESARQRMAGAANPIPPRKQEKTPTAVSKDWLHDMADIKTSPDRLAKLDIDSNPLVLQGESQAARPTTLTKPALALSPVHTLVETVRPTLHWRPHRGASGYTVSLWDASQVDKPLVSQSLQALEWKVPVALQRGQDYEWWVTATTDTGQIESQSVRFGIIEAAKADKLGALHRKMGDLYRAAGLREKAENEYRAAMETSSDPSIAQSRLQELKATLSHP